MNKFNSTISMQINVGYSKHWSAAYNIFAVGSYTDVLLGETEDVESRKLEMSCNEPWILVYAEDCNGTSQVSVVGFDGSDIRQYFFDESKFWHPFFTGLCNGTFENSNYFPPEEALDFLGLFDNILDEAIGDALEKYCQEHDCNDCKLKCNEAQGLLS